MKLELLSEGVWDNIKNVLTKPLLGSGEIEKVHYVMEWGDKETVGRLWEVLPQWMKQGSKWSPPSRLMHDPSAKRLAAKYAEELITHFSAA